MTEKQASRPAAGESFHTRKADLGRWLSESRSCTVSSIARAFLSTVLATFSAAIHLPSRFRGDPIIMGKSGQGLGFSECAASAAC